MMELYKETALDRMDNKRSKFDMYLKLIIMASSVMTFLVVLTATIIIVPKTVKLMNTAQRSLDNLEVVSDELKNLELAEAIKTIEDNTAIAMSDVSNAMEQVKKLDIDSLNQSIQELKETTEKFSELFED